MENYTANIFAVRLSPEVYTCLLRWMQSQGLNDVNQAANAALKRFLKHQEFYSERETLQFYTHPVKVKILRILNVGGANLGYIVRGAGSNYETVKSTWKT